MFYLLLNSMWHEIAEQTKKHTNTDYIHSMFESIDKNRSMMKHKYVLLSKNIQLTAADILIT